MAESLSIARLAPRVASRELSVERLIEQVLGEIGRADPSVNAFITVLADRARVEARRADAEIAAGRYLGPLHGMPIAVKDLVDVEGAPTTAASHVRDGHLARRDAPLIARLRAAGAVIIGKTNLHEFAYGTTSEDSAYGAVHNPRDLARSAGGSSGGSAAALAAGMCAGAVGTDTGGSIRIPSAVCGIVGLKPAYDEISCEGVVPLSRSLDHAGPMAADVESTWLLHEAMTGRGAAPASAKAAAGTQAASLGTPALVPVPASNLRIGVPRRYFLELLDDEVRARFDAALDRFRRGGSVVTDVDIPHAEATGTVYLHIQLPESSAYHAAMLERAPERYTPPVRLRLEMGRYVLGEDTARAQQGREVLRREVDRALDGVDVLALPALAIPAPSLGQATVRLSGTDVPVRAIMLRLTQLFNVTGHPAIALPAGNTRSGLPTSLQLVGRRDATRDLLRVALEAQRLLADSPT